MKPQAAVARIRAPWYRAAREDGVSVPVRSVASLLHASRNVVRDRVSGNRSPQRESGIHVEPVVNPVGNGVLRSRIVGPGTVVDQGTGH